MKLREDFFAQKKNNYTRCLPLFYVNENVYAKNVTKNKTKKTRTKDFDDNKLRDFTLRAVRFAIGSLY